MWWQHPDSMEGEDSGPCRALRRVCGAWTLVCEPGRESSIQEKEMDLKTYGRDRSYCKKGDLQPLQGAGGGIGAGLQSLSCPQCHVHFPAWFSKLFLFEWREGTGL